MTLKKTIKHWDEFVKEWRVKKNIVKDSDQGRLLGLTENKFPKPEFFDFMEYLSRKSKEND